MSIRLVEGYDQYGKLALETLNRGISTYADILHMLNGMSGEVCGEILSEFKKYFAYRKYNHSNLKNFDRKILAEELGDFQWFCAVFRILVSELLTRMPDSGCEEIAQLQEEQKIVPANEVLQLSQTCYALQADPVFYAVYSACTAIGVLSSTVHHELVTVTDNERVASDLVFRGEGELDFDAMKLYSSDIQLCKLLCRPIYCALAIKDRVRSLYRVVLTAEAISYRVVTRLGESFPGFTQERVWTANIAKLQQIRYKKGSFSVGEAFNREIMAETDIIRAIMGESLE